MYISGFPNLSWVQIYNLFREITHFSGDVVVFVRHIGDFINQVKFAFLHKYGGANETSLFQFNFNFNFLSVNSPHQYMGITLIFTGRYNNYINNIIRACCIVLGCHQFVRQEDILCGIVIEAISFFS